MKKVFSLILAFLMLCGMLAGCSKNSETEQTQAASAAEPANTVITVSAPHTLAAFEAGLEAAYPSIDLQVEVMETGVINGEVSRRLRNGHGSDLIITNLPAGDIKDYAYNLSATSVVEKYESSITNSIKMDGLNLYLPLPGSYYGFIVNKTLLDTLGLSLPETSADLLNTLSVAKEKNIGVQPETGYGFGLSDIGATFLGAYYTGCFAADFLSTVEGAKWQASFDAGEAGFAESWTGCIDFLKACVDNGYMDPNKLIVVYNGHTDSDANAFKPKEMFAARNAILTFGNLDILSKIQSATEDEIVMLPCLPASGDGNALLSAVSNNYIAVNKALESDAVKLAAALNVLEYLSTVEGQTYWINDSNCPHSYLSGFTADLNELPESIRSYVQNGMIFTNPFPTNLLSFIGKSLTSAVKGKTEITAALAAIDDYYRNGSDETDYDLSIVGTVTADMLYENSNTRKEETALGNFICDAIKEVTGADVVLVNGGGIRSSLYKGDVTGEDLANVCPYGNLIIISEMDGATLRAAITNGIQKTWKPAGQFLQVAGIKYSFKPAANETETAELVSLTYADGTELKDSDIIKVAYTNYMGGSSGYVDAGDGFTMLNVYDASTPITVKLITETGLTYGDALKQYFAAHNNEELTGKLEGRITVIQ